MIILIRQFSCKPIHHFFGFPSGVTQTNKLIRVEINSDNYLCEAKRQKIKCEYLKEKCKYHLSILIFKI